MRHKKLAIVPDAPNFLDWTPTREDLNALRRYLHDLESHTDIVALMRENFALRQEIAALKRELAVKQAQQKAALLIDHFFFPKD